ncbi:thermonuclease family protein [Microbulbifer discodermiae]|uniref:thermonuclease family protein n=1 Tax=Microbulbifer sp. 2201CG32-9 TaxID=3232309 RepID=UPI00345C39EE
MAPGTMGSSWFGAALRVCLGALAYLLLPVLPVAVDCVFAPADELVALREVRDGDTLILQDGRRVRLIGVNTPELARADAPAQPLAQEAKRFSERFLGNGGLELVFDQERYDRYGRLLAHVYNHRGESLESALLSAGLAFHIAIAPNLTLAECLSQREQRARQRALGVWAPGAWPPLHAAEVGPGDGGFVLLLGRVQKAEYNRFLWLHLDGPVTLRLSNSGEYGQLTPSDWQGAKIEVRGWLVDRGTKYLSQNSHHKRWFIAVDSKFSLKISRD